MIYRPSVNRSSYRRARRLSTTRSITAALLVTVSAGSAVAQAQGVPSGGTPPWAAADCSPDLTARFAPTGLTGDAAGSPASSYEVCRTSQPFDVVRPAAWMTEELTASEVFVATHPQVRAALGRLYGGKRLRVARGWLSTATGIDAVTLVAPAPSDAADRIVPGTLVIHNRTIGGLSGGR
jgi:hypothetical protein